MRQCIPGYTQLICSILLWLSLNAYAIEASLPSIIKISDINLGNKVPDKTIEILEGWLESDNPLQIAALPSSQDDGFQIANSNVLNGRFNTKNLWLRFTLYNDLATPQSVQLALMASWLQRVNFYLLRMQDGQFRVSRSLEGISVVEKSPNRVPQVALNISPRETVRVLVNVNSNTPSNLGFTLQTVDQWHALERNYALFSGILIGSIIFFAIYSAALWSSLRAPFMAWQTLALLLIALYEATYRGYARIILWPSSTEWSYKSHHVLVAGIILCTTLYFRARLKITPSILPTMGEFLLKTVALLEIIVLLGVLIGPYEWFATAGIIAAPTSLLIILGCTYVYHRNGGPGGRSILSLIFILTFLSLLRFSFLLFPSFWFINNFQKYIFSLPAIIACIFYIAIWIHNLSLQRHQAQSELLQWQCQQKARLEHEVEYKNRTLKESLEKAAQHSQEQKQLLAYVSHDLRAPVSVIITYLRQIIESSNNIETEKLSVIEKSATYQLELIDDLVEYAKDDLQPRLTLNESPEDLRSVLSDIERQAHILASRNRNIFLLEIQSELPTHIYLDQKRLKQVVLNLISNAAKFTSHGIIDLRLRAKYLGKDQWNFRFEVSDSGSGIDPETLVTIQKFLAEQGTYRNRGLGLVIAHRIIEKMTGHLTIESQPGGGTNAIFFLMITQVSESPQFREIVPHPEFIACNFNQNEEPDSLKNLEPLTENQKIELEKLATRGSWSDLHAWIDSIDNGVDYKTLVDSVKKSLDDLDFKKIIDIARSTPLK